MNPIPGNPSLFYDASGQVYVADDATQSGFAPLEGATFDGTNVNFGAQSGGPTVTIPRGVSGESWLDLLTKAVPAVVAGLSQFQLQQINIQRARAGLPALPVATYAANAQGFQAQSANTLLYGGLALAALWLITSKK